MCLSWQLELHLNTTLRPSRLPTRRQRTGLESMVQCLRLPSIHWFISQGAAGSTRLTPYASRTSPLPRHNPADTLACRWTTDSTGGSHPTHPTESIKKPRCLIGAGIIHLGCQRGHSPTGLPSDDRAPNLVRMLRVVQGAATPTDRTSI